MKKVFQILVMLVTLLGFTHPQTTLTKSISAPKQQAPNPRPSRSTITDQLTTAEDGEWVVECVDCPKQFEYLHHRSLQVDSEHHAHIAYGGDHLYYAWHDGVLWHYEIVDDSPQVGYGASLAIDHDGYPHIFYSDSLNTNVKYANLDNFGWHTQTVDTESICGSQAVDQGGIPHVSYSKDGKLIYAYLSATEWITQTLDTEAGCSSIALDVNGQLHISYISWADELM